MKLLFDENLSPHLVNILNDLFPGSMHVHGAGLGSATDGEVWKFALANAFTIVSKDADFHERSVIHGFPPKVVWIKRGNCSTQQIAQSLRSNSVRIVELDADSAGAFLLIR